MFPRKGDMYECPACRLSFVIMHGCEYSEMQTEQMRCCCGSVPVMVRSGAEPAGDVDQHNIVQAELEYEHEHSFS